MSKQEYLDELRGRLRVLPEGELNDALEYYEGYISDADNEEAAINELGSPAEVAATTLAGYASGGGGGETPTGQSESNKSGGAARHEANFGGGGHEYKPDTGFTRILKNPDGTWDGFKLALAIIIAIFALPMAFPIVIGLAMIPLSLFIALCVVVFSFGVTGVALVVAGVVGFVASFVVVFTDIPAALMVAGASLLMLGLGVLFIKLVILMARGFGGIARMGADRIRRRKKDGV